jgi:hypothetical protein
MNKNDLKKRAAEFFKLYPNKTTLFATADGNFFLDKAPAKNHANSAKIECFEFNIEDDLKTDVTDNTEELNKKVLGLDPETADYKEMSKILKGLGFKLDSWVKPNVIEAFKTLKAELSKVSPAEDGVENNLNQ